MNDLVVTGMSVRFGGVVALDDVAVAARGGGVTGLIGPNGSGKTTLLDAVCGLEASTGSIRLGQTKLDGLPAFRRARLGVARTFQGLDLVDDLTVTENVRAGRGDVTDVVAAVGLEGIAQQRVGALGTRERHLTAVARALVGEVRVLLLDEPVAGLDPEGRRHLARILRAVAEGGVAVVVVDHDSDFVFEIADSITVLHCGKVLFDGPPSQARRDPDVVAAYLGT